MDTPLVEQVRRYARHVGRGIGALCAVFDFADRQFDAECSCVFCESCALALDGRCDYLSTHRYGCYEAERWNGLYIYYCPLSLSFTATIVYEGTLASYALVSGPCVIGATADVLFAGGGEMAGEIQAMQPIPAEVANSQARLQWAVAMFLSGRHTEADIRTASQATMMNTLYDVTDAIREGRVSRYPVELEKQLQGMISTGNRQGAQELINQLLSHVYFQSGGNFALIKERAIELVILFSRASIEGGADAEQILGSHQNLYHEIERFQTVHDLSLFLSSIFNRFVGYVFDFSTIKHTDILYKAVNFVREKYAGKLTLDGVARHVGLSPSYLSTLFREELGSSFTDYINAVRVEKSKDLLLNSALSLAQIADLVGFSDQSYYTKVFSRVVGTSPGQYRKTRGHYPNK